MSQKGTLYQLKNLLHRTSVPKDPKNHMKACEDFLILILHAFVKVAAEDVLKNKPTITDANELAATIVKLLILK